MNGKIIVGGLVAVGLFLWAGSTSAAEPKPEPEPEPDPKPDPKLDDVPPPFSVNAEAEAQACASATEERPEVEAGQARGGKAWDTWLTWVAFVRAYGRPPTSTPAESARVAALLACVRSKLEQPQQPQLPNITPNPTPGAWYRIKYGDTLYKVSKAAYPTAANNHQAAKRINDAPENVRFRRYIANEEGLWGKTGRITFMPIFGTYEQQRADSVKGGEVGAGGGYAVIWIPPAGP